MAECYSIRNILKKHAVIGKFLFEIKTYLYTKLNINKYDCILKQVFWILVMWRSLSLLHTNLIFFEPIIHPFQYQEIPLSIPGEQSIPTPFTYSRTKEKLGWCIITFGSIFMLKLTVPNQVSLLYKIQYLEPSLICQISWKPLGEVAK